MRIVVFGGSGFLGSHVCDVLSNTGHDIIVADCKKSPWLSQNQTMSIGDITDSNYVEKICQHADIVLNFAGIADLGDADLNPTQTAHINIMGNMHILEACRKAKIERYIFASSLYVYGQHGGFYRCSKQSCELFIEEYHKKYGLEYTILRYGSIYGERADNRNGIYKFIKQAITENKITYYGAQDAVREYVNVQDMAQITLEILKPDYSGENIVITGNQPMKISNLFLMISEILGKKLEIEYLNNEDNTHYFITPYSFMPKVGKKLQPILSTDLGQGLLKVMAEINNEKSKGDKL